MDSSSRSITDKTLLDFALDWQLQLNVVFVTNMEMKKMSLPILCLVSFSLVVLTHASRSETCGQTSTELVTDCHLQLDSKLREVRSDDPDEVTCCLIDRLQDCLSKARGGQCESETESDVRRVLKKTRTIRTCEAMSYPSITCYVYLYRDWINIAMLVTLFAFSSYALIVCCRTCCLTRPSYRMVWTKHLENRPLIIVTHHH